jgi:hypothetical protein
MMLQNLHLYGLDGGRTDADDALEQRFITWLARDPSPLPALKAAKFSMHFGRASSRLADRAFHHFAWCARLNQLQLSEERPPRSAIVSQTAIEQLVAEVEQQRPPRRPFIGLRDLAIAVDEALAVPPFTRLPSWSSSMPSSSTLPASSSSSSSPPPTSELTRLALAVRSRHPWEPLLAALVLPPLALPLPQLRVLRVQLGVITLITGADLRALAALTQLDTLELTEGDGADVGDDDLAAMLRPLHALRTLVLWFLMPHLAGTAMRVVGAASPGLRHLECLTELALDEADGPLFGAATTLPTPLFPHLEYLDTGITKPDGDDHYR